MPRLINWSLMANPVNWAIVWLMIGTFGLAIHVLAKGGPSLDALD
jgi:hypothetical protein